MRPLINFLQSSVNVVKVLYLTQTRPESERACQNVAINLSKAGIRPIPLTKQCIRLKNGSQIIFLPTTTPLNGIAADFLIIDGFIDEDYVINEALTRLKAGCEENYVQLGGGMAEIRDYARTNAYRRLV